MLNGIKHFLEFVSNNWTTMFIIIALITVAYVRINAFLKQSDGQKIAAAKAQIKESMLKLVGDAEADYQTWKMAGSLKRSMVIQRIFADSVFPAEKIIQAHSQQGRSGSHQAVGGDAEGPQFQDGIGALGVDFREQQGGTPA